MIINDPEVLQLTDIFVRAIPVRKIKIDVVHGISLDSAIPEMIE